ncbi:hypothetical protein [Salmonella phage SSBI34]|nr:hypothetical protein [Salmonella phage SSBI34]
MKIVYFQGDEWEGLYINGWLRMEGESLDVLSVLMEIKDQGGGDKGIESVKSVGERGNWLVELGGLPATVAEMLKYNVEGL